MRLVFSRAGYDHVQLVLAGAAIRVTFNRLFVDGTTAAVYDHAAFTWRVAGDPTPWSTFSVEAAT